MCSVSIIMVNNYGDDDITTTLATTLVLLHYGEIINSFEKSNMITIAIRDFTY